MKLYSDKKQCCGCGACAAVCPADAVQMRRDGEGFLYPHINRKKCIACGKCETVCPLKRPEEPGGGQRCFGAKAKDEKVRYDSSSGGIFSVLAEYVFELGGSVYGAAYGRDMKVEHREARDREELRKIRKTKYVQSSLSGIFQRIAGQLEEDRWVLFCGTPCQTDAVRLFLGKPYSKLITVDVICYGVPSPGIWNSYVKYLERRAGGSMTDFSFRDKRNGDNGHACSYVIDGREYAGSMYADPYCQMYFANKTIRPACHVCRYCTPDRKSDFTLGDFWGIENVRPNLEDGMGISAVILHTKKAGEIWERIRDKLRWFACREEDLLQPRLSEPTKAAGGRRRFMLCYRFLPFSAVRFLFATLPDIFRKCRYLAESVKRAERKVYNRKRKKKLRNENFTIISSNCNGSFMYHDLGLRYMTPTVNLSIGMDDFVKMAENLKRYMEEELMEAQGESSWPVGMLGDIRIQFVHYASFSEAAQKWEERKKRINWENLFIVGTEKDGCSYETLRRFDRLPFQNKVIFTRVEYPEFASAHYMKGFEKKEELGVLTNCRKQFWRRRYLDDFDYVTFLNKGFARKLKEDRYD